MANTAHGLPYPVGTDRVMDGDDAIKALAEAVDLAVYSAPFFKGTLGAAGLVASAAIQWVQQENIGGGTYVQATGLYTVPKAGLYRVSMAVKFNNSAAAVPPPTNFRKNGTAAFYGPNYGASSFSGNFTVWIGRFAVGDTISSAVTAGGVLQSDAPAENNFLQIEYVRA